MYYFLFYLSSLKRVKYWIRWNQNSKVKCLLCTCNVAACTGVVADVFCFTVPHKHSYVASSDCCCMQNAFLRLSVFITVKMFVAGRASGL